MKIGIIGLGLIGGSMALDLKSSGFSQEIFGHDAKPEHARRAKELGLVNDVLPLEQLIQENELLILATPVGHVAQMLPMILDQDRDGQTVMDVGSTKGIIAKAIETHPRRYRFVLTHPMAGTEFSGPDAAIPGLFANKATVICDQEKSDASRIKTVRELYLALKMRVVEMTSEEHDLTTAYVSHLSHITSFVLANTVLDKEKDVHAIFNLASAGFESTVRLAKSSPEMWAPIFEQNQSNIAEALGAYIERLQIFHKHLLNGDYGDLRKTMQQSNEIRRVLTQIQKGHQGEK